jgi:hypothetical protein
MRDDCSDKWIRHGWFRFLNCFCFCLLAFSAVNNTKRVLVLSYLIQSGCGIPFSEEAGSRELWFPLDVMRGCRDVSRCNAGSVNLRSVAGWKRDSAYTGI